MATNPSRRPDFGLIAERYDQLRPGDADWLELFAAVVREGDLLGQRVLDVGCGTGRFAAALSDQGAEVWGAEPEQRMAAQARERLGERVVEGSAEALPFSAEQFDRVTMWRVVHLLERAAAFREIHRVLASGGRIVIVTLDPTCFPGYWLNQFFPSLESIDRARYPEPDTLINELTAAGFAPVQIATLHQRVSIDRETALKRVRGRFMSTLLLLADDEYAQGLRRIEREVQSEVVYDDVWMIAVGHKSSVANPNLTETMKIIKKTLAQRLARVPIADPERGACTHRGEICRTKASKP